MLLALVDLAGARRIRKTCGCSLNIGCIRRDCHVRDRIREITTITNLTSNSEISADDVRVDQHFFEIDNVGPPVSDFAVPFQRLDAHSSSAQNAQNYGWGLVGQSRKPDPRSGVGKRPAANDEEMPPRFAGQTHVQEHAHSETGWHQVLHRRSRLCRWLPTSIGRERFSGHA